MFASQSSTSLLSFCASLLSSMRQSLRLCPPRPIYQSSLHYKPFAVKTPIPLPISQNLNVSVSPLYAPPLVNSSRPQPTRPLHQPHALFFAYSARSLTVSPPFQFKRLPSYIPFIHLHATTPVCTPYSMSTRTCLLVHASSLDYKISFIIRMLSFAHKSLFLCALENLAQETPLV